MADPQTSPSPSCPNCGQPQTTLTPEYQNTNKKDIQNTLQQSPWEAALKDRISKGLGLKND